MYGGELVKYLVGCALKWLKSCFERSRADDINIQ